MTCEKKLSQHIFNIAILVRGCGPQNSTAGNLAHCGARNFAACIKERWLLSLEHGKGIPVDDEGSSKKVPNHFENRCLPLNQHYMLQGKTRSDKWAKGVWSTIVLRNRFESEHCGGKVQDS